MKKRGNIFGEYLIWWIIAIIGMALGLALIYLTTDAGTNAAEFFKNLIARR